MKIEASRVEIIKQPLDESLVTDEWEAIHESALHVIPRAETTYFGYKKADKGMMLILSLTDIVMDTSMIGVIEPFRILHADGFDDGIYEGERFWIITYKSGGRITVSADEKLMERVL